MKNKKTIEVSELAREARKDFTDFLLVRDGKFFIETYTEEELLCTDPLNPKTEKKLKELFPEKNIKQSGKYPLRCFTDEERKKIEESDFLRFTGGKIRSQGFQHLLNRFLDFSQLVDIPGSNKNFLISCPRHSALFL